SVKAIGHGAKKVGKVSKKAAKSVTKGAKKVVDFVKEHPKEIAIGLAIVAVGAGAYYLGSVAFAGAAAAGAGATSQGTAKRREDEEGHGSNTPLDSPPPPPKDPMPLSSFLSEQEKAHLNKSNPSSNLSANLSSSSSNTPPDKTYQFKNGISSLDLFKQGDKTNPSISGQPSSFNPPAPAPQGPSHLQSIISGFLQVAGKLVPNPINEAKTAIRDAKLVFTSPRSCHIETEGFKYLHLRIGFINGMNTTFEEAQSHLEHIRKFTGGMSVEGVYNHSNTALADAVEIFTLNYAGFAPRTAELLIENWTRFHEENINTPDAKYLQFAHSMGTILTRDALAQVPQEIRDRI